MSMTLPDEQASTGLLRAAGIRIREAGRDAPWDWLSAGWGDLTAKPVLGLVYGAFFAIAAAGLAFGLTDFGQSALVLALAGGFLLVGPMAAVGLYEASRRRELDRRRENARRTAARVATGFHSDLVSGTKLALASLRFGI